MASDDFGEPFDGGGGRDFGGEGGLQEDADPILGDPTGDRRDSDNSSDRDRDTSGSSGSGSGSGGGGGGGSSTSPTRTVSGSTTVGANFPAPGSAPTADAPALDRVGRAAREAAAAQANPEIIDRATTGGFLSERNESAGLLPPTATANTPRGQLDTDISETRFREIARTATATGRSLDVGAISNAQAAVVAPFAGGQGVDPDRRDLDPLDDRERESVPEEVLEGGASFPFDFASVPIATETGAEVAQSTPGVVDDFDLDEIGETATAVGRDRAAAAAAEARANPGETAGRVGAGVLLGGAGVAASGGSVGSGLRAGLGAELDPRVGPLGTTFETRAARGVRDFLDDDRGQAQLVGRSRGRESGGRGGEDTDADADDDLGPDVGPFDRSDARLFDPSRDFDDDVGGMQDAPDPVDPADAESRQDIGAGIGGRGEPGIVGSDAETFSERGFGDVEGTELDPDPTSTLDGGFSAAGAGTGGLFGVPGQDDAAGTGADGLLGAPGDLDSTGATPGVDADTRGGVDLDTGFTPGSDTGTDTDGGTDTDTRQDTRQDSGGRELLRLDADTRIDARDVDADTTTRDPIERDPRDPQRRDPDPLDFDPPDRRDRDLERERERERRREQDPADIVRRGETVINPTQSLAEVDDALTESLDF